MRAALFAIFGLVFGSFLTVVVHRVPRKEGVAAGRSRCPRCGSEIRARDNVPVLSWLLLRGRCRFCGNPISVRYPLTELATAGLFAGASLAFPDLFRAILVAAFLAVLLALALIDAEHKVVPNAITYPALGVFAAALVAGHLAGGGVNAVDGLIGLAAYGVPLFLIAVAAPGGMGMGDVKLAALIGLVLGSLELARVAVAAGAGILLGGVGALVGLLVFRMGRKGTIPFGPFLAAGGAVGALAGPALARAYLSLFS